MFLQIFVCLCDRANNEMASKEVIVIIVEQCGSKTHNNSGNQLKYFIRYRQLHDLKSGGRVIYAQNTTTKRSCVNVE